MRLHRLVIGTALVATIGSGLIAPTSFAAPAPAAAVTTSVVRTSAAHPTAHERSVAHRNHLRKLAALAASRAAASRVTALRMKAVALAKSRAPKSQYVAGARGPYAFDCAGFTWWVWHQMGRNIPDNTWGQRSALKKVSRAQAKPGDIALFMNGAHHSELYIGNNKTVGCSNARTDCKVKSISGWYAAHFTGFYRVI